MFLGHTSELAFGQAKSIEVLENKKILINDNGTFKLGSNICPHQNSRIISGTKTEIRCQYHGWAWHMDGVPKDSGSSIMCNQKNLHTKPVYECNGLLFEEQLDFSIIQELDFKNLRLDEFRIDTIHADPKISMDIFLDVDHIDTVHNGMLELLGISGQADISWDYADWGSMQTVTDDQGKVIARWIAVYPFTMIEWQDHALFVTRSINSTQMAVWKYKDIMDSHENYIVNSNMWENAFAQDKQQAEQMIRFPSMNLETAKVHYRNWLKNNESIL